MFDESIIVVVARGVGGTGDVKLSPANCWLTNLSIAVQNDEDSILKYYLYYFLKSGNLRSLDSGSAQSQITINALSQVPVVIPSMEIQKRFDKILNGIFTQKEVLEKQNVSLKEARELLLPRLMDGRIEV